MLNESDVDDYLDYRSDVLVVPTDFMNRVPKIVKVIGMPTIKNVAVIKTDGYFKFPDDPTNLV